MPRPSLTPEQAAAVARRLTAGEPYPALMAEYGVSKLTLYRVLKRGAPKTPRPRPDALRRAPRRPRALRLANRPLAPHTKALGEQLRALRTGRRLTRNWLAGATGMSTTFIADIEAGKRRPRPELLRRLAQVLGGDYDDLARLAGYDR